MEWNWLQLVAALGTLVALTTLILTIVFGKRDSQTRLRALVEVRDPAPARPTLGFRVIYRSKTAVMLVNARLEGATDGRTTSWGPLPIGGPRGRQVQPGPRASFAAELPGWSELAPSGGLSSPVLAKFSLEHGTGAHHEWPVIIERSESQEITASIPEPHPWYRRWF